MYIYMYINLFPVRSCSTTTPERSWQTPTETAHKTMQALASTCGYSNPTHHQSQHDTSTPIYPLLQRRRQALRDA